MSGTDLLTKPAIFINDLINIAMTKNEKCTHVIIVCKLRFFICLMLKHDYFIFSIILQIYIPIYTYNVLLNLKEFLKRLILIPKHVGFFFLAKFSPPALDVAKQPKLVG